MKFKKQNFFVPLILLFVFFLGYFSDRLVDEISRDDVENYFENYGRDILFLNSVLDDIGIKDDEIRREANKLMLLKFFCSPMFFYLPTASEKNDGSLRNFWDGYSMAFNYSGFDKKTIKESLKCEMPEK